jgi:Arc/MetJ-type ribon-helix-helix transcriptional regulator
MRASASTAVKADDDMNRDVVRLPALRYIGGDIGINMGASMKTIAITIDDPTIAAVDALVREKSAAWRSRSAVIRDAVKAFVNERQARMREEREGEIIRKNRARLRRQAAALVREQAKP